MSQSAVLGITKQQLTNHFEKVASQYPDGPVKDQMLAQFNTAMQRVPDGAVLPTTAPPVERPAPRDLSEPAGAVADEQDDNEDWLVDETMTPAAPTVLEEAAALIYGDREDQYGDPRESFGRIAGLWSAYLGATVTNLDVANLMILLKVSRTKGRYQRDSYVDIGGYAGNAERIAE